MSHPDDTYPERLIRVASPEALRDQWLAWGRSLTAEQRLAEGWRLSQRLYAGQRLDPNDPELNRMVPYDPEESQR